MLLSPEGCRELEEEGIGDGLVLLRSEGWCRELEEGKCDNLTLFLSDFSRELDFEGSCLLLSRTDLFREIDGGNRAGGFISCRSDLFFKLDDEEG